MTDQPATPDTRAKACPFCGQPAFVGIAHGEFGCSRVTCSGCLSLGGLAGSEDEALKVWNERSAPVRGDLEALVKKQVCGNGTLAGDSNALHADDCPFVAYVESLATPSTPVEPEGGPLVELIQAGQAVLDSGTNVVAYAAAWERFKEALPAAKLALAATPPGREEYRVRVVGWTYEGTLHQCREWMRTNPDIRYAQIESRTVHETEWVTIKELP